MNQNTENHPAVPAVKTAAKTPAVGFASIKVQGIFYNESNPSVMINGRTLLRGESINGVQVVDIQTSSVVVSCNGEQKKFLVK